MNSTETKPENPSVATTSKKIADNIRDALALSRKLEQVLNLAHEKMLNRDIAGLETLLEAQVKLLNMLQLNGSLRAHYLKEAGLPDSREGMQVFISICSAQPTLATVTNLWQQLEEYANRCRSLNRANGKLLSRLAATTNRIITLMFTDHEPSTYNEQGICDRRIG